MAKAYRPIGRLKGWYEYYNTPCDICGHEGMCMINEDNNRVVCCRVESERPFGKKGACPGYLHFLDGKNSKKVDFTNIEVHKEREKKDIRSLNIAYQFLLKNCEIAKEHLEHLVNIRGMTEEEINVRQYNSFPEKPWQIVNNILRNSNYFTAENFLGVPGFYTAQGKNNKYVTISGAQDSILIPCRDITKQIVGFQYRLQKVLNKLKINTKNKDFKAEIIKQPNIVRVIFCGKVAFEGAIDENEKVFKLKDEVVGSIKLKKGRKYLWLASSGKENGTGVGNPLPIHLAVPFQKMAEWTMGEEYQLGDTIWITEGLLKADRIAQLLYDYRKSSVFKEQKIDTFGSNVFGLPGVQTYNLILPLIKQKKVKRVVLAYDIDAATNDYVKMHLFRFSKELSKLGVELYTSIWNADEAKGLDDLLHLKLIPTIVRIA